MQRPDGKIFGSHLLVDERVLWEGKPRQGIIFRTIDILWVPFSLAWGGLAFFWTYQVWSSEQIGWSFLLWSIPFTYLGVYFIFGRLVHDMVVRRATSYAITDKRILIMRKKLSGTVIKAYDIARLPALELKLTGKGGQGSIFFEGYSPLMPIFSTPTAWVPAIHLDKFEGIDAAEDTFRLIQRTAAQ